MDFPAEWPIPQPGLWLLRRGPIGALFLALLLPGSAPLVLAQSPAAPPAPAARFVVVIDAAHGGSDSGAALPAQSGGSQPEKSLTLALSIRLRSLLVARGISVVTTRESDTDLAPERRAEIANHAQAQACLILHAANSGSGVHLFLSSLPPAQPARFLPWKTAQAASVDRSFALAGMLNFALQHAGIKVTLGQVSIAAIDSMTCPAVAVEIAPESKPEDVAAALADPGYQTRIAQALAAGILEWRSEPHQP